MDKVGKRTWNKDKKDNPIVKDLPKNKDKFKFRNIDVGVDIEILQTDKNDNPCIVKTPASDTEPSKYYKINYKENVQKHPILQISEKEYNEKFA